MDADHGLPFGKQEHHAVVLPIHFDQSVGQIGLRRASISVAAI